MFDDVSKGLDRSTALLTKALVGMPAWARKRQANKLRRELNTQGYDAATIEACANAVAAGQPFAHFLKSFDDSRERIRESHELLANPPPDHGSARWTTRDEVDAAKMLRPIEPSSWSDGSLLLGLPSEELPALTDLASDSYPPLGRGVFWNGRQHLVTVAAMRTGKSFTQIVPNLLNYRGAAIVLDPKGELFQQTSKWRADNVGPVYVLNPFSLSTVGNFTDCFDPLSRVRDDLDRADERAVSLAATMFPDQQGEPTFFPKEVRALMAGVFEFFARYHPYKSLADVLGICSSHTDPGFNRLLDEMAADVVPSIATAAEDFQAKNLDGKRRTFETFNGQIAPWRTAGVRRAVGGTDFQFQDLKTTNATIYLTLPFEQLQASSTYVTTLLSLALDALTDDDRKPEFPILMILDELLALDPFPKLVESLRRLPGYGIRVWTFLQNISDLQAKYPHSWKSFFDAEVEMYFGLSNYDTLKLLSERLGDATIARHSSAESQGSAHYSINDSLVLKPRRLMTETELREYLTYEHQLLMRHGIHLINGLPGSALRTVLMPWKGVPEMENKIGSLTE